jgi:hypothetical protein
MAAVRCTAHIGAPHTRAACFVPPRVVVRWPLPQAARRAPLERPVQQARCQRGTAASSCQVPLDAQGAGGLEPVNEASTQDELILVTALAQFFARRESTLRPSLARLPAWEQQQPAAACEHGQQPQRQLVPEHGTQPHPHQLVAGHLQRAAAAAAAGPLPAQLPPPAWRPAPVARCWHVAAPGPDPRRRRRRSSIGLGGGGGGSSAATLGLRGLWTDPTTCKVCSATHWAGAPRSN